MQPRIPDRHDFRLNRYPKGGTPIDERARAWLPGRNSEGHVAGCSCDGCDPFAYNHDGTRR